MSFGAPLGLLGLLALLPLVAAYFLRRKRPPRKVSALFLWRGPDPRSQGGPRLQRFTRETSLLLEVMAVALASLFLADVRCGPLQARERLVVLDDSLSLSARHPDGRTSAQKSVERLRESLKAEPDALLTVVLSGAPPRLLGRPRAPAAEALAALAGWRPSAGNHDLQRALTWAKDLAGAQAPVELYTDAPLSPAPPKVRVVAVGAPLPNQALLSVSRVDTASRTQLTARLANFDAQAREVTVTLQAPEGKDALPSRRLRLEAGAIEVLRWELPPQGVLKLSLPEDALSLDGAVTLRPALPREVKSQLLAGLPAAEQHAVQRFLAAMPELTRGGADAPLSFGARGSEARVTLGAPGAARTFVGPFFSERAHPWLEDVELAGVVWTAGTNPPGRPLVTAGDAVLVSEEGGRLHLNVDLGRSSLARTDAWPVLLGNFTRAVRDGLPGFPRGTLTLGEPLRVTTDAAGAYALEGPGGSRPLLGAGPLELSPALEPGEYRLMRDGVVVDRLEVLPLDAAESDLRTRASGVTGELVEPARSSNERPRQTWLLACVLALVLADLLVTSGLVLRPRRAL